MRQQLARFTDDRRVTVKRCVSFAGGFSGSIMIGCDIGNGGPLRFAVYAIKRLIPGIRQHEKTICAFLDRGFCFSESCRNQRNRQQKNRRDTAMHGLHVSCNPRWSATAAREPVATCEIETKSVCDWPSQTADVYTTATGTRIR